MRTFPHKWATLLVWIGIFFALPADGNELCAMTLAAETPYTLSTALAHASDRQRAFYFHALVPVLMEGHRLDFVDIRFEEPTDDILLSTPNGTYRFSFADSIEQASPRTGMPHVEILPNRVQVHIRFFWPIGRSVAFDLERAQGVLRSGFRADPYPYPLLRPHDRWNKGKVVLSHPQEDAISGLLAMEDRVAGKAGLKRALVMPPGSGKTLTAAYYIDRLGELLRAREKTGWGKKPKILFVVQSNNILDEATQTFERELDLRKIARIYGPDRANAIENDSEMIAVTRSGYFSRREEIQKVLTRDRDQPWVILFDEGHEYLKVKSVALQEAQFHTIRQELESVLDERHRVLLLSATLWHRDKVLIKDYLGGNIFGSFLTDDEQTMLQNGNILDLQVLCRTAWYRSIQQGYSPPLNDLHIITSVDGTPMSSILDYNEIMHQVSTRKIKVHHGLLKDVAKRIKRVRIANVPDRAVFFVPSIAHANAYAPILSGMLGEEVRAYHGGELSDPDTYDWFNDRAEYDSDGERKKHKYILVIRMLHQGTDTRAANLIGLLRPYGYSPSGFRALIQNTGRAGRPYERKPYFRLLDWTGFSRVLVEGIESIIVEPFEPGGDGPRGTPLVVVNEEVLTPIEFRGRYYDLFEEEAPYTRLFPFFDLPVFQQQTLRRLHEEAYNRGVHKFGNGDGAQEVVLSLARTLLQNFPCPELEDLIYRLEFEWGWSRGDGTAAKVADTSDVKAVRRIYEALYEMAAIVKGFPEGETLDLSRLHTEKEFEHFLDLVDPNRVQSLLDLNDKLLFIDREDGAWGALYEECRERGFGTFSDAWAAKTCMEAVVRSIPDMFSAEREALLNRVLDPRDMGLKKSDSGLATAEQYRANLNGGQNRARNRESFQRIYRVLFAVARIMEKHPEATDLDAVKIHERGQTELLFSLLRPNRIDVRLDDDALDRFLDKSNGAIRIILDRSQSFGIQSFARSAPELLLAVVDAIPLPTEVGELEEEREQLALELSDTAIWGWNTKTGGRILEGMPNHARRYFRALCKIAHFFNKIKPETEVNLRRLHLATEMERFLDLVQIGIEFPYFTKELETEFRNENDGALAVLAKRAKRDFGVPQYQTNYGPKFLFMELVRRAREADDAPLVGRIASALESDIVWGWKPSDASVAKSGRAPGASKRVFRGLYASAYVLKRLRPRANRLDRIQQAQQTDRMLSSFQTLEENSFD